MTALLSLLLRGASRLIGLLALIVVGLLAWDWARGVWDSRAELRERLPTLDASVAQARVDAAAASRELAQLQRELDDTIERTVAAAADEVSKISQQHAAKLVELSRVQSAATLARQSAASARLEADRARKRLPFYERTTFAAAWSEAAREWVAKDAHARLLEAGERRARNALQRVTTDAAQLKARSTHQQLLLEERIAAATEARQTALAAAQARTDATARALQSAEARFERARAQLANNAAERALAKIRSVLPRAVWLLLLVLALPLLWKLLFYYGVARWVAGRSPIQLAPTFAHDGASARVGVLTASAVSVELDLDPREQLLVKSAYLQSSSRDSRKDTVAVLSMRYWLSSLAAGMVLLTRLRPAAETPTRVRVTATDDVLGELCVVLVPAGEGLVLRPSALAGAIHSSEREVAIRSHWRLSSLHAWCSWQLRFLEFQGPCRLIVKGTRGVRIETLTGAESRLINGSATLGFTPSVPFRVTRTETFVPYLLGDEPLFNDLFGAGRGVIVYEERPSGRDGARVLRFITGWFDAFRQGLGI